MKNFAPPRRLQGIQKSLIRQVFDRALPGSLNLGLGESALPTPDVVREAAIRVIREEQNGYTSHAGLPALREKIAGDYEYLNGDKDRVIVTAGSQEALYLALLSIIDEGDEVLLPNPGFVAYPTIVQMAGGKAVFYELPAAEDFSFDIESFRRALTPRTRAVVCISPSNPTGRVLTRNDLAAIADALKDHDAYLISDEIYRELYYGAERPASATSYHDRTIVISGLSKSMSMTGWRLGWICGEPSVIKTALVLHGYVTTCASAVSQKASLTAWSDEAESARAGFRQTFKTRRDHLLDLIKTQLDLRAGTPDGAFYTMVDVTRYGSSMEVAEALLRERLITIPGSAFGSQGEGHLRVSFCAGPDLLSEAVERMRRAFRH